MNACLDCGRTEQQVPLLVLEFRGGIIHICPQCLPTLIHKPEKLASKLPGMDTATDNMAGKEIGD
jgi:hypothetical protein